MLNPKNESKYEKFEISIIGMTCSNCSNYLELSLKKIPLIKSANVNLILENALIVLEEFDINKIILNNINIDKEKIKDNGTFLKMIIETSGFSVVNLNKIEEDSNKITKRIINVIFQNKNIIIFKNERMNTKVNY